MGTSASGAVWAGRIVSAVVALALLADGAVGLLAPRLVAGEMAATGFPPAMLGPIAGLALASAGLYALPPTRGIGAILVTGYLGGAICTHLRLGEIGSPPQIVCLVLGALAWAGLWLRDPRLRALLPVTR